MFQRVTYLPQLVIDFFNAPPPPPPPPGEMHGTNNIQNDLLLNRKG